MKFPFNVRAYGVLIHNNQLLLIHESYPNLEMIKLPGGGLEFGEGLRDGLKREFYEELGMEITVGDHLYTTDFFQPSAFDPENQIIAVYYRVEPAANAFHPEKIIPRESHLKIRWQPLETLDSNIFTFPIDRIITPLILKLGNNK